MAEIQPILVESYFRSGMICRDIKKWRKKFMIIGVPTEIKNNENRIGLLILNVAKDGRCTLLHESTSCPNKLANWDLIALVASFPLLDNFGVGRVVRDSHSSAKSGTAKTLAENKQTGRPTSCESRAMGGGVGKLWRKQCSDTLVKSGPYGHPVTVM